MVVYMVIGFGIGVLNGVVAIATYAAAKAAIRALRTRTFLAERKEAIAAYRRIADVYASEFFLDDEPHVVEEELLGVPTPNQSMFDW